MEENEYNGLCRTDTVEEEKYSEKSGRYKGVIRDEKPTCAVCMEVLGTHGGPASLACGHNGCLECLQQVQMHSNMPVCPLCRTPFDGDINLAPNLDLRAALECAEQAAAAARAAEDRRMVAVYNSKQIVKPSRDKTTRSHQQRFIYDLPYPEETGPWIPVSIPPKGSKDFDGPDMGSIYGDVFPEPLMTVGVRQGAPDINLWNVLSGFLAIISGRGGTQSQNFHSQSGYSDSRTSTYYRESSGHGRSNSNSWSGNLHRPSAPPLLLGTNDSDVSLIRAILEAEPPDWMPDSSALSCMLCGAAFRAITCGRHHCRFCGGIFCRRCSSGRCLLPVKFRDRDPKRVCDTCWERLEPVQKNLADRVSNAAQIALHDVTDFSCMTAWINSPLGLSMEQEIFKATNALRSYLEIGVLKPERSIPDAVLKGACGLAIITVFKAGFMMTYKFGTGLVVSRRRDGSWSAPSAIASCGLGWGAQAGGELTDFIIVLRTEEAVKAFSGRVHLSVGAGLSVAAGPVGRAAEADLRAGDGGTAACYTYSRSKGAFVGCSIEGNVVATRSSANMRFYGESGVTAVDILLGDVPRPRAAAPLYSALDELFVKVDT
ncbi:SH3 domain-containing YSC84-like protein 1 [Marchantia polymorpha subsp. ruderalis]|uniref:RING-type domain-containing protein n=2 Tax=Marchantia polymorpha TaxID=3197 RepID=A0AAF6AZP0_MARPO|nr:hypothetical protein MARPO_0037s0060 [Marchantia polymorpha]PTQ40881.1 hypothetical protein MARPO_0037s0060 [Marchantia polymorpha]BBN05224.1 hypothetical protein Mp_3g11370 [Marchantia polymorpha subsp. ruderalis]BBN05225.1 hypothetical protein Mp_3g11370 [Marchantia polymorpha subsp. ruderalis]|eukprot:PTQ40880.1 hypothetical protein MARPO_0037s0060 [Marchantia polymorpha]